MARRKYRYRKKSKSYHLKFVLAVLVVAFVFGTLAGFNFQRAPASVAVLDGEEVRTMLLPAVTPDGEGMPSTLTVKVKKGSGLVLVNINNLVAGTDTQESAKFAVQVASEHAMVDTTALDIIFSIDADAASITGTSAGAAMAITTIAALEDKDLDPKVSMTGAISPEGRISMVGSIEPKIEAVKQQGITRFFVPGGQGHENIYSRELNCDTTGSVELCRTNYVASGVNLGTKIGGIEVIEVNTINDIVDRVII